MCCCYTSSARRALFWEIDISLVYDNGNAVAPQMGRKDLARERIEVWKVREWEIGEGGRAVGKRVVECSSRFLTKVFE